MNNDNKHISARIWVVFSLLALFGLAIIGKVFKIQILEKEKWSQVASSIDKRELSIPSTRGDILSTDGTVLAVTVPTYSVYWDTQSDPLKLDEFVTYMDTLAECFAKEFPTKSKKDYIAIFKKAMSKKSRYAPIVKKIDFTTKQRVEKFPFISKGKYKSGFIFEKKMTRTQLFDNLAERTIGRTYNANLKGQHGLELTYDKELAGVAGKQLKTRIPGGVWKPVSDEYIVDPVEGMDLVSSIDVHLQDLTQFALKKKLEETQAEWGCAILMEVKTGYIRAITNLVKGDSTYYEEENLAVNRTDDPGSTFKLPVLMAVLEDKLMSVKDSIDTGKGYIKYYDKAITDTHGHGKGTVADIFAWSSNVGMAKMVDKCYKNDKQKFLDRLNGFGLGKALGVEIVGERTPKLYKTTHDTLWSGISHVQMAMGYEVNLTPLQILTFYNAVANNGKMMKPLFSEALMRNRKVEKTFDPVVLNKQIASEKTIETAQALLQRVCQNPEGTAYSVFKNTPYLVAGKTGTARILEHGKYQDREHRGSFVGYFPADNPEYSCIVVVHKPKIGSHYGASVGAPVFKEIADQIFNAQIDQSDIVTNIDKNKERTVPVSLNGDYKALKKLYNTLNIAIENDTKTQYARVATDKHGVKINHIDFDNGIMPDLKDMALQDVIFLLENMGLQVQVKGVGRIKKQSIKKGTKIEGKHKIVLELA